MSYYSNLLVPPKAGTRAYLWKINRHEEIVIEALPDDAPVVSSSREMVVITPESLDEALNEMLSRRTSSARNPRLVCCYRFELRQFGVNSLAQLATQLNSKGSNKAKTLWKALPYPLLPDGIRWDATEQKYVVMEGGEGKDE